MQISENFTFEELTRSSTALRRGISNLPDAPQTRNLNRLVAEILQPVRTAFGRPIRITSGFRSPSLNNAVGGVANSQHLTGEAADLVSDDNRALFALFCKLIAEKKIRVGQLINEHNYSLIHVSLPSSRHINQIIF